MCGALEQVYETLQVFKATAKEQVSSSLLQNILTDIPDLLQDVGHWVKVINEKAAR